MNKTTGTFTLDRLNNSVNGNPRYRVFIEEENGNKFSGVTASDSSLGYSIGNYRSDKVVISWRSTRAGNVIITDMEKVTK